MYVELAMVGNIIFLLFKDTLNKWVKRPEFIIFVNSVLAPISVMIELDRSRL